MHYDAAITALSTILDLMGPACPECLTPSPEPAISVLPKRYGMRERRLEIRLLCSDLIRVRLEGAAGREIDANLEDISPSGACVLLEQPVAAGAAISLLCRKRKFRGVVKYCVHHEIGYLAGVQFDAGHKWSRELYEPKHLVDPTRVKPPRPLPGG
jgi:hypothetical protein